MNTLADSSHFIKPFIQKEGETFPNFLKNIYKSFDVPKNKKDGKWRKELQEELEINGFAIRYLKSKRNKKYVKITFENHETPPRFRDTPRYKQRVKLRSIEKDVKRKGQVFTPDEVVDKMLSLRNNDGSILEPSAGDGSFIKKIRHEKGFIGIEKDLTKCPDDCLLLDFFNYSIDNKFDTIIGNPPYVRFQDIEKTTKLLLNLTNFDERSNLCFFFIDKCIYHLKENGELILIVPRDFLKATSSKQLNEFIYDSGTITDIIDLEDINIFGDFSPNCIIFRFEKDNFSHKTNIRDFHTMEIREVKDFVLNSDNQLLFLKDKDKYEYGVKFGDLFTTHVGAVSGLDKIFTHEDGNKEFVYSKTADNNKTRSMFHGIKNDYLERHKEELLNRKIKTFDENNWWEWGRNHKESSKPRIYVNCKTRKNSPFFTHKCKNYDGSVLAIFNVHSKNNKRINEIIDDLNAVDWKELGFMCDNRFIFSQRSLQNIDLPENFKKYL